VARWLTPSEAVGLVVARSVEIIPDPEPAPSMLTIAGFDFEVPEEWRARLKSGANFEVRLVLHVVDTVETPSMGPKWRAKWLEVRRLCG